MGDYLLKEVHDEYVKRMEGEHDQMNKRLSDLETAIGQQGEIVRAVDKLALNMEKMLTEQRNQGDRLDVIEGRDGEMWRKAVGYLVTAIIGIIVGFVATQLGM